MTVIMGLENFVPVLSQWQFQSENNIYDSFNDWDVHNFLCLMKDGKEVSAYGFCDENYLDGFTTKDISFNGMNNYKLEDIVLWMEIPVTPKLSTLEIYGKDKVLEFSKNVRKEFIKELGEKNERN